MRLDGTAILDNTIVALTIPPSAAHPDDIAIVDLATTLRGTVSSSSCVQPDRHRAVPAGWSMASTATRSASPTRGSTSLADNGGPTQTIALLPGSPAIDAGSNALAVDAQGNPLTTDQRGTRLRADRRQCRRHRCLRSPGDQRAWW